MTTNTTSEIESPFGSPRATPRSKLAASKADKFVVEGIKSPRSDAMKLPQIVTSKTEDSVVKIKPEVVVTLPHITGGIEAQVFEHEIFSDSFAKDSVHSNEDQEFIEGDTIQNLTVNTEKQEDELDKKETETMAPSRPVGSSPSRPSSGKTTPLHRRTAEQAVAVVGASEVVDNSI